MKTVSFVSRSYRFLIAQALALSLTLFSMTSFAQEWDEHDISNRLIIKFRPVSKPEQSRVLNQQRFEIPQLDRLDKINGMKSIQPTGNRAEAATYVLTFDGKISRQLLNEYRKTGLFEYVEPDFIGYGYGTASTIPNDTYFSRQWYHVNDGTFPLTTATVDADMDSDLAWDITQGSSSTVVAILDTGIKPDHPEFVGRAWQNSDETQNGVDTDGNTYMDDLEWGWDFVNDDNYPIDDHGHGTSVAGVAVASGDNGVGYAGMDWKCQIMICKVLDNNNSGLYTWWADAIYYAVDNGATVINLSAGGNSPSTLLEDAINYAYSNNVPVFACTGNQNSAIQYPARYANAFAIGATRPDDTRYSLSNFGSEIDFVAPGTHIYTLSYTSNTDYSATNQGTSFAAPQVAGLVSLMFAVDPGLSVDEIRTVLENTSEDQVGDPAEDTSGWDRYFGHGRINAYQALREVQEASAAYYVKLGSSGSGTSFSDAFGDLQEALDVAIAGNKIYVAAGTYKPSVEFDFDGSGGADAREATFQIPDGVEVYGGFPATATGTVTPADIAARDFTADETILSGDLDNNNAISGGDACHVVFTKNVSSITLVDGFTITGGNANTIYGVNSRGGGWYNEGDGNVSNPILRNCGFSRNSANFGGGGMCNDGRNGTSSPMLINCSFTENNAQNGGGMYNDGRTTSGTSSPILTNCSFTKNTATDGGGMLNDAGRGGTSNPVVRNSIFWENNAVSANSWFNNSTSSLNVAYTLVEETSAGALSGGTSTGAGMIYAQDPLFTNATSGTLTLEPDSPAIDAGNDAALPAGVTTDLAGNQRIQGSAVDMGAFETSPAPPTKPVDNPPTILQPVAPTDLTATGTGTGTIFLEWTDRSDNETEYRIFRSTGAGGFNQIATVPADSGAMSYTDTNLQPDTYYIYMVYVSNGIVNLASNQSSAATFPLTPVLVNTGKACAGGVATLEVTGNHFSQQYNWYTTPTGGTPIENENGATLEVTLSSPGSITYYAAAIGREHESEGRVAVSALFTSNPEAVIADAEGGTSCDETITLTAQKIENAAQYIWSVDTLKAGEGRVFEASQEGEYRVRVIDENGCSAISEPVQVNPNFKPQVKLNPNPTTELAELCFPSAWKGEITVNLIDNLGKQLQSLSTDQKALRLDLSQYAAGTYFVQIITEKGTTVRKLVRQ